MAKPLTGPVSTFLNLQLCKVLKYCTQFLSGVLVEGGDYFSNLQCVVDCVAKITSYCPHNNFFSLVEISY